MRIPGYLLLYALLASTSLPLLAQDVRWVTDQQTLDLRSGPNNQYKIVKYLRPGTRLRILEVNTDTDFSKVAMDNGFEGWINNRYLMNEPSGRAQLAKAKATIARLTNDSQPLRKQLLELETSNTQLTSKLGTANANGKRLSKELERIKTVSSGAIELDRSNKSLMENNQLLQHEIDVLKAENERLEDESDREWFLNGAFVVAFGAFLAMIIPRLTPKRKHTEWH